MPSIDASPDWVTPCRESLPTAHRNLLDLLDHVPWELLASLAVLGLLTISVGTAALFFCGYRKIAEAWARYYRKPRKKPSEPAPTPAPVTPRQGPPSELRSPTPSGIPNPPPETRPGPLNEAYAVPSGVLAIINNSPTSVTHAPDLRRHRGRSATPRQRDQTPRQRDPTQEGQTLTPDELGEGNSRIRSSARITQRDESS